MTLKKQLMDDFKAAMKSHDEAAKNTISFVRAAIKHAGQKQSLYKGGVSGG